MRLLVPIVYLLLAFLTSNQAMSQSSLSTTAFTEEHIVDVAAKPLIPQAAFCKVLDSSFERQQSILGIELGEAKGNAHLATLQLIDQIRSGKASEYMTMTHSRAGKTQETRFIAVADLLRDAIGAAKNKPTILVLSTADLRFLPFIQAGSQLLVIAKASDPVQGDKALSVAAAAENLGVTVHVIWYGSEIKDLASFRQASGLALVAQKTGGRFVNLSGPVNPCGLKS